ncbi:unnamed protein product [Caenorhabditis bovis]|uniref:peptidylamidoglycolate lyase n=1 Tax=Caenorhabditis bovis TaxID=2654633 RepID=A0A8S1FAV6_9PELO|nr:unnamed protein product [Caenorhabditis bovis]
MQWASLAVVLLPLAVLAFPYDYFEDDQQQRFAELEDGRLNEPANALDDKIEILATDKPLGQVSGLAVNPKGDLVAFHRANRVWDEKTFNDDETLAKGLAAIKNNTIAVMSQEGKVLDEFGADLFYMPHGLTIDSKGNLWVTDVGSHQVHKIDGATKKIVMSLGEKMVPGNDAKHFCKPTDVAVASNGHFFVADGYCNSRVLKFDAAGNLIATIDAAIESEQPDEFVVPHSISLIEDLNMICIADRENQRVQCFSAGLAEGHRSVPTGIPITAANDIGRVYAIRERDHYLIGVTGESEDVEPQLFTIDMNSGTTNTFAKGIENAHALAISAEGNVFVSQLEPSRILKLSLV